jgi:hypothetical protein
MKVGEREMEWTSSMERNKEGMDAMKVAKRVRKGMEDGRACLSFTLLFAPSVVWARMQARTTRAKQALGSTRE